MILDRGQLEAATRWLEGVGKCPKLADCGHGLSPEPNTDPRNTGHLLAQVEQNFSLDAISWKKIHRV
jgi:hypothetical protein